jgi:hypothetical protein
MHKLKNSYGLMTTAVGAATTVADCGLAAGFGFDTTRSPPAIMPCALGTYNDAAFTANTSAPCTACPTGRTTSVEGASKLEQCQLCSPGYGGANCATQCGGLGTSATYGPAGRTVDDPACLACSTQATGYSFEWQMQNALFQSQALSRTGANASTDCVAQFGQLQDRSW